jgi:hypothetical protein
MAEDTALTAEGAAPVRHSRRRGIGLRTRIILPLLLPVLGLLALSGFLLTERLHGRRDAAR